MFFDLFLVKVEFFAMLAGIFSARFKLLSITWTPLTLVCDVFIINSMNTIVKIIFLNNDSLFPDFELLQSLFHLRQDHRFYHIHI